MSKTVAILGPGAVGGSLAVRLSLGHVHTICVGRPETIGIIAMAGLVIESRRETLAAQMEVTDHLAKPVSLLLVTVKAPDLADALERIDPESVSDGVVVPLLNGLEHMDVLRERFHGRVAAGSISHFVAYRAGRVQIVEATPSPIITIASEELPRGEMERAAETLRLARIDVRVAQSEKRVLWHKVARISVLTAATAASGRTVGELRNDAQWRPRLEHAVAEVCAVAEADGVALRASGQWTIIDEMVDETTPSATRDVAAGRRSELDAIVGAVLRASERLGVPCPTLTHLATQAGWR